MARPFNLLTLILLIVGLFADVGGCGTRVVVVPDGRALRLAEDVEAYVYVEDEPGHHVKSGNRVTLHEGGYYKALSSRPSQ